MLTNGFGIIAFISVTPLITVQALGILYTLQVKRMQRRQEAYEMQEFDELAQYEGETADEDEAEAEELGALVSIDNHSTLAPEIIESPSDRQKPNGLADPEES